MGNPGFDNAQFDSTADFAEVHFADFSSFYSAYFPWHAAFNTAHFAGVANFRTAYFSRSASFETADFAGQADFHSAQFAGDADFSNGASKSKTIFIGAEFDALVPQFYHCEMHQDTTFTTETETWPKATPDNAEQGKKAYTRLRQIAAETHDPDLEHFFLRQEMRCKEAIEAGKRAHFYVLLFRIYRWISDYGYSVSRPTAWLLGVWALGAAAFAGYFASPAAGVLSADVTGSPLRAGLSLSFANLFGFLGLSRLFFLETLQGLPDALQFLAGFQTVAGVVLVFFLGLGLRNRFRLH